MTFQTKVSTLVVTIALAAAGVTIAPVGSATETADAAARPGAPGKPKLVTVTVSDARFRPGITEFKVSRTAHRKTSITVFETKDLDRLFKKFGEAGTITTVHRQDIKDDRYLLSCWMPSEEQDGVPHAMMGMWLLVNGR